MSSYNSNHSIEIIVNIYELNPEANNNPLLKALGMGFYHTGVEINGVEY